MFLAKDHWQNMFDPILWRSSPHYPLLLPSMNVFFWIMQDTPTTTGPLINSIVFTFLLLGLLIFGLKDLTKSIFSAVPAIFILSLPLFQKLAYSQYNDLLVAYFLLASFFCLIKTKETNLPEFSFLGGIFLGVLSFTKNEGLLAALLILLLSFPYLFWRNKQLSKTKIIKFLFIGLFLGAISTLIFTFFYAPKNITFINGLVSSEKPITLMRIKIILAFYFFELFTPIWNLIAVIKHNPKAIIDAKWMGIWVVTVIIIIMNFKKCFALKLWIIPVFLLLYNFIIIFYYLINTYFQIDWWLQVTLHRILFSVLPTVMFWIFYSLWQENKNSQ